MNPASIICDNHNITGIRNGIITIASQVAQGKTFLCNSIFYHFLESGINVIYFSEDKYNISCQHLNQKSLATGLVIREFLTGDNFMDKFTKLIKHKIPFIKGRFVIIIDCHMFLKSNLENLEYNQLLSEYTRAVLFEKTCNKKQKTFITKDDDNKIIKRNVQFLQNLSYQCNIPIIITTQTKRGISHFSLDINTDLMLNSTCIITSEREQQNFTLKVLKSRYGNPSIKNVPITCFIDTNTNSFVTNN